MSELTLREIRLKLGMTVDEMAEVINVPKSSYSYWESKNKISEEHIQKIQKLYDDAMEHMDDGIDIVEKIGTIKRHYKMAPGQGGIHGERLLTPPPEQPQLNVLFNAAYPDLGEHV